MHARAHSSPPRLRIVVTPPPAECAKCGFACGDVRACPRCGLATASVTQFLSREAAGVPAELVRTWEIAVATWHCPEAHDALLELARKHEQYAWLARSYRQRRGDRIAERQLARVARAAELSLALARAPRDEAPRMPYRGVVWIVVVIAVALASAGLYAKAQARANPASRASDSPSHVEPRSDRQPSP